MGPDQVSNQMNWDGYHKFILQDQNVRMIHREIEPTKKFEIPKSEKSKKDIKKEKDQKKKEEKGFIK